ncbi:MAG: cell division protein ZapA [Spirochaetales bacterium]|jgi:cell division protein ZapA (FtsZ GTPase activity inhibitor)|nr:cell division protein ZapA [Spirochaetales bacterium]
MGKGIPIHVLGTHFTIQTDESPEYVERLVEYVTKKIESLGTSVATKDGVRLSVLAAILIADELFKERSNSTKVSPADGGELENITENMIARIDAALEN